MSVPQLVEAGACCSAQPLILTLFPAFIPSAPSVPSVPSLLPLSAPPFTCFTPCHHFVLPFFCLMLLSVGFVFSITRFFKLLLQRFIFLTICPNVSLYFIARSFLPFLYRVLAVHSYATLSSKLCINVLFHGRQ